MPLWTGLKTKMCPLPALCSLIAIYPARQGFTGLLNKQYPQSNSKHFHVMSIGGRLQGSYNTICCPQCQRWANTNRIIYIGHCSCVSTCVSTVCLRDIITRDQISQGFPLQICILQRMEGGMAWKWPGNEARATSTGAKCAIHL